MTIDEPVTTQPNFERVASGSAHHSVGRTPSYGPTTSTGGHNHAAIDIGQSQSVSTNNSNTQDEKLAGLLTKRAEFKQDILLSVITVIIMGLLFGIFMNKGRVFEPLVIRDQFRFERFIMLKMFISAAATSCFCLTFAYYVSRQRWELTRDKQKDATNIWATAIGSLTLGAGMALAGACPGMVWMQVGSAVYNSLLTLLGCFIGAFIFGLIHPFINKLFVKKHFPDFLDEALHIPYPYLSIACGVAMIAFAIVLEFVFPWKDELTEGQRLQVNDCTFFDCVAWNPIICGVGVGSLQIPCSFILGNTLGSASCYVAISGQWLRLSCVTDYVKNRFNHFKAQLNRWWQVTYIITAAFGSYIAMIGANNWKLNYNYSPNSPTSIAGGHTNEIDAILGGFLMIFGARLAKGCTSGHGLSGCALMTTGSFLSVGGMFLGGGLFMLAYTAISNAF